MATYTSYDLAHHILQMRSYTKLSVDGFAELPTEVLSAILHQTAEWRDVYDMETLIKMGANPHETHGGFTVLENFIQGHDGYWICRDRVKEVEDGVKMLTKYGVTDADLKHPWILSKCKDIIDNSEYLRDFFGIETPERVKFYWHLPRAEKIKESPITFKDVEEGVKTLHCLTDHDQYIAILEYKGVVTRYLVTKKAGPLQVIPMEHKPGWTKEQAMVSNIVNFVMARDELPYLVCEDEDDDEDEDC